MALGVGVAIVDQAAKALALRYLGLQDRVATIIPNVLSLEVIRNSGAAFGLFQWLGPMLALITVVLMYVGYKIARHEDDPLLLFSLTMILGGAAGNLVDRVFRGAVIDFFHIPYWPLFNVADCAISIGTAGILYYGLVRRKSQDSEHNASHTL